MNVNRISVAVTQYTSFWR